MEERPVGLGDNRALRPADLKRRAGALEEPTRGRDGHFIARADRDDAGDELLERRSEAVIGQLEERGFGKRAHRRANAADHKVNVASALR